MEIEKKIANLAEEINPINPSAALVLFTLAGALAAGEEVLLAQTTKQFTLAALKRITEKQILN